MIKPLREYCMIVLCSHIGQFDDFPPMVPSGLLGILTCTLRSTTQRLIEKKMVTSDVLNLFLRSPMQTFHVQKVKTSGITINSPNSCAKTIRVNGAPLLQQILHLKTLSISQCPVLDTLFVVAPNLSTVFLPDVENRDNIIKNILLESKADYLDISGCLQLQSCTLTMNSLESLDLSSSQHITQLHLTCDKLKVIDISKLTELEEFHIKSADLQSLDVDFKSHLKELNVEGSSITKISIRRCPLLLSVDIKCSALNSLDVSYQNPQYKHTHIRLLAHSLLSLSLTNSKDFRINLEDNSSGKKQSKPMKLNLSNCVGLSDSKLVTLLQNLSNVQWLDLSNTDVSDITLLALLTLCPNLETLNLTGTSVSLQGMRSFSTQAKLSRFNFVLDGVLQQVLSTSEYHSRLVF